MASISINLHHCFIIFHSQPLYFNSILLFSIIFSSTKTIMDSAQCPGKKIDEAKSQAQEQVGQVKEATTNVTQCVKETCEAAKAKGAEVVEAACNKAKECKGGN